MYNSRSLANNDSIVDTFLPSLFGASLSDSEVSLFSLPPRLGGLGIRNPVLMGDMAFRTSRQGTDHLVQAMRGIEVFSIADHMVVLSNSRIQAREEQLVTDNSFLECVLSSVDPGMRRSVMRNIDGRTSCWLTALPLSYYHFDFSPVEFRDALFLRYGKLPLNLPDKCDGCGGEVSLQHLLDCKRGGLVIQRHNEIRDSLGDLCALSFPAIVREPVVREANDSASALVADLGVRGVWQPQTTTLIDVRVVDTDAPSYVNNPVSKILQTAESEKSNKYLSASLDRRASFSPFVVSIDGVLGREAECLLKVISDSLSRKWGNQLVKFGTGQDRLFFFR